MDGNIDSNIAVLAILDNQSTAYKPIIPKENYSHNQAITQNEINIHESNKQNIIWTKNATLRLLSLYETKVHMLDNPKKKSKMWVSMAEELKSLSVEVTPDQVRWKINALTKKYKDCIDNGQGAMTFKYFNEMHKILGCYHENTETYRVASGVFQNQDDLDKDKNKRNMSKSIPFRKLRAESRAKVELDKQWIEYLRRQEEQKQIRDERYERSLKLREEELQIKKKELEIKHSLALKKLQLKEKKQEEMLKIEKEKCAILRALLAHQEIMRQ